MQMTAHEHVLKSPILQYLSCFTCALRCRKGGIGVAQLHGDGARSALPNLQGTGLEVVYVMHATPDGQVQTPQPQLPVDWVLIDGLQVGSCCALPHKRIRHTGRLIMPVAGQV
jgi:hypothetical protein